MKDILLVWNSSTEFTSLFVINSIESFFLITLNHFIWFSYSLLLFWCFLQFLLTNSIYLFVTTHLFHLQFSYFISTTYIDCSVISAPFLSSTSLIFSDLTPSIIMYFSKLSCNSPNSHVDAKFFSYPMYWSNVSSSF